jgi:hypothetical protein
MGFVFNGSIPTNSLKRLKTKNPANFAGFLSCCGIGRNQHPSEALDFTDFDDMPKKICDRFVVKRSWKTFDLFPMKL